MANYNLVSKVIYRQTRAIFSRISGIHNTVCRHSTLRRAALYVPGYDLNKLKEAALFKVDCLIMNCEDGVPFDKKVEARETIKKFLDEGEVTTEDPEWCIRVNPVQTPDLCEEDLNILLAAKSLPCSICLPKISNVDQLQWFAEKVWNVLIKRNENDRGPLKLIMLIESPEAILNLSELCKKAEDLSTMAPIVPVALMFERNSLCANLGIVKTESQVEIFYARQKLVLTAKAFGLQAIDSISLNYKNVKKLVSDCHESVMFGFTGKQVFHASQVVTVQEAFIPTRQKIKWAEKVVYLFEKHKENEKGKTKLTFKNELIDVPMLRQAENVLKRANLAGKLQKTTESSIILKK